MCLNLITNLLNKIIIGNLKLEFILLKFLLIIMKLFQVRGIILLKKVPILEFLI